VAGLSAANTFQRLGVKDPLVAENKPYTGGLAATMSWKDCRMDLGPHRLHTIYPEVKELIHSLVGEDLVVCNRTSQIYMRGKWMEYPPRAGEMIACLGLVEGARIGASALCGRLKALFQKLIRGNPGTYGAYLESRFGNHLRELIFDPFALKVYREGADDLDEMVARVRLASQGIFSVLLEAITGRHKSSIKTFLYPNQGMGLISARLAERIENNGGEVLLEHEAVRIRHSGGLVRTVELRREEGDPIQIETSHLITTIPLVVLLDILEPAPPESVKTAAGNLTYADSFLVYTLVDKQPLTPNCWMYFPEENIVFSRVFELYNFCPDLVPEGMSCLCAEIPARPTDPTQFAGDDELKSRVWDGFKKSGMARDAECVDQVVIKVPRAYPIYRLGYQQELKVVLDYLSGIGNLISTGRHGLFHYNNSDHSMEMGRLAAEYAHQSPENSANWYAKREEFDKYRIVD